MEKSAVEDAPRDPITSALLQSRVKPGNKVVIVHGDVTRATPNDRNLPVILVELESAGVARCDIVLLNGLGPLRPLWRLMSPQRSQLTGAAGG